MTLFLLGVRTAVRTYASSKHRGKNHPKKALNRTPGGGVGFHVSEAYRPTTTSPHSLAEDKAAALAYNESKEGAASSILSIEDLRRKVNAKKNVEKVIQQVTSENEDPLIRQAYEELEDEDRIRRGLAPLRRAPPGKLRVKWDSL